MIQDIHNHTYYSFCGHDRPEDVVEAAIAGGIELFGICDHQYGVGQGRKCVYRSKSEERFDNYERTLRRYYDHLALVREKYADRITLLLGVEVCTDENRYRAPLPDGVDISFFDYCLVEQLDSPETSSIHGDIFTFAERCGCPTGIAHTDLFAFIRSIGEDPFRYLRRMAEQGIFWEMNVSYASTHHSREHAYMHRFFASEEEQAIVRESGVRLSVGFDGHIAAEYRADRVIEACQKITAMGIKLQFED